MVGRTNDGWVRWPNRYDSQTGTMVRRVRWLDGYDGRMGMIARRVQWLDRYDG